jgi:hypothetical protein
MTSCPCKPGRGVWFVAALLLVFSGVAQAQEIEGTWKLVSRKLPDGTRQVPPAVQGAATWRDGLRNLVVFAHTPEGKPWSFSLISNYKLADEWSETLLVSVYDDGSGKAPAYNLTGETKIAPVTRENQRIAFKPPFEPVSYVFEGDKWTATLEGVFVDYWERVR